MKPILRASSAFLCSGFLFWTCLASRAAEVTASRKLVATESGEVVRGVPWKGAPGIRETVATIMERQKKAPPHTLEIEAEPPRLRPNQPRDNPDSPSVARWPEDAPSAPEQVLAPQTYGLRIKTIGISESGFIPPDTIGTVGPGQILACANGKIKTFSKTSGTQSGLNADLDTLFASVNGGSGVSDTHVRYDRLSGRFFIVGITVNQPNRVVIAVSNASTITSTSSFTFFQFQHDLVGPTPNADTNAFLDYPTLGVDANALYIGGNVFGGGTRTTGFVVNKADLLSGTLTVSAFRQLLSGGNGPWTPQGVDNDEPQATEGYFIGVGQATFGNLILRRVTNPGGTPSISGNIILTVPATSQPITQAQMGSATNIDAVDDRLLAASIRKNKLTGVVSLWTAHHVQVNGAGIACSGSCSGAGRNGSRWYEIGNLTGAPTLLQSGTLFDPAATNPKGYWFPSVAATGQGHMALGSSMASANDFASVTTSGRLRTDALGTQQAATVARAGAASYVLLDPNRNRWGDYSQTAVDPDDDQTIWTFQEFCDTQNNWATHATQLKAPPPATPSSVAPSSVCQGRSSVNVTVTGTSSAGSEFFDPGADPGGPGYVRRLTATPTSGVTVNTITFVDPTHFDLDLSTLSATPGPVNIQVRNPDRQVVTGVGLLTVVAAPAPPTAGNNGPLCEGGTIELTASTVPDATYAWTGPGGFASNDQNPTIPGATAAASGDYAVTVTVGGCASAPAITTVAVTPAPADAGPTVRLARSGAATDVTWDPVPSATGHDVLRGSLAELPVGPGNADAGEICLANDLAAATVQDPDDPAVDSGFWYVIRGVGACGNGPYGFEGQNGVPTVPRTSGTCP